MKSTKGLSIINVAPVFMTRLASIFLIFSVVTSFGQTFDREKETQKLLTLILSQDSISRVTFDLPVVGFSDYEFDGEYSLRRIFPQAYDSTGERNGLLICATPLRYETSIHNVLQTIDANYDSVYYQNEIKKVAIKRWSDRGFTFSEKKKFIKRKWLYDEINEISIPIFNKSGDIALIKFSSVNRKSILEKEPRIWIFTKIDEEWKLVRTINSTKNWS